MILEAGGDATYVKADVEWKEDVSFVPCADYPEEMWDKVININLKGVYLSMKYQIPEMLKRGGGAIVNGIGSRTQRRYGRCGLLCQ